MFGAAFSGMAGAAMDNTGITKGFFYDGSFNPTVQVVVGEKGMASDAVAAGNIAATLGNLAYVQKATTAGGTTYDAQGKVTISVTAEGAVGKYVKADGNFINEAAEVAKFYDDNTGVYFRNESKTYEKGQFIQYSMSCDTQERSSTEGILKSGSYKNVHCLFCNTLCLKAIENPAHDMSETITVDSSGMTYYEDGMDSDDAEKLVLEVPADSLYYTVKTGYVPMEDFSTGGNDVDFEWRGQMLFLGEDYYVKDIKGTASEAKIYMAKGSVLNDVSSEGYTAEYNGYKFKIDHLIYSAEYQVAGILLDVEKPDGTVVQTQISRMANGLVDSLELSGVVAEEADAVAKASIIVYDKKTEIIVGNNDALTVGGTEMADWWVSFVTVDKAANETWIRSDNSADDGDMDISEYSDVQNGETALRSITVSYTEDKVLEEGESIAFPLGSYKLKFEGFKTSDYMTSATSGGADCITVEKDNKYELLLSFTTESGERLDNVHMSDGPFKIGDMFMANSGIYKFTAATKKDDPNRYQIEIEDVINGGKDKYILTATNGTDITLRTNPFESVAEQNASVTINRGNTVANTGVYESTGTADTLGSAYMFYTRTNGKLYLSNARLSNGTDTTLEVDPTVTGNLGTSLFQANGNDISVQVLKENGTADIAVRTGSRNDNRDDTIVVIKGNGAEYYALDVSDRSFDDLDTYYSEIAAVMTSLPTTANLVNSTNAAIIVDDDKDSKIILPKGGDVLDVDWGADYNIKSAKVCHPQEDVYATYFIGTAQESTTVDTDITKDDKGKTITAGCCSFTVADFAVEAGDATATTTTTQTVNPVPANMVVPEVGADISKKLIVVGGPSVNGMCTVTVDEIAAATGKYVVKLDGNKVIVAGMEAADTVSAGNALISWLKANVHA